MAILYDPPAAAAVRALMAEPSRRLLADRTVAALRGLASDPGGARFRRRPYAPHVDWGFVIRTSDDEFLILWDWDSMQNIVRVRYAGPDLLQR